MVQHLLGCYNSFNPIYNTFFEGYSIFYPLYNCFWRGYKPFFEADNIFFGQFSTFWGLDNPFQTFTSLLKGMANAARETKVPLQRPLGRFLGHKLGKVQKQSMPLRSRQKHWMPHKAGWQEVKAMKKRPKLP